MKRTLAALGALAAMAGAASAAPVTRTDLQTQTVAGQNFNFVFSGLAASDGTGGTLVLRAQGDYDGGAAETLAWDAEGVVGAAAVGGFVAGMNGVGGPFDFANVFQGGGNIEFQRTYNLSALELDTLLADGTLSIFVDLASTVGLFQAPNFVEFTLSYNSSEIPVPAALPLFAAGLAGFGALRRKRKAA